MDDAKVKARRGGKMMGVIFRETMYVCLGAMGAAAVVFAVAVGAALWMLTGGTK